MFGISTFEMLVIAAVALVVLGPEKFPEFAKGAMRVFTDIRGYMNDVKRDVEKEMRPVTKELKQLSRYNPEQYIDKIGKSIDPTRDDAPPTAPDPAPAANANQESDEKAPAGTAPAGTMPAGAEPAADDADFNPEPDGPSETPRDDEPAASDSNDSGSTEEFVHPYERLEQEYGGYSSPERQDG